jgi:cell division initiation protein
MKLTPLDIRHKEFKRGMRGYADVEVDEFLDEVADEYERLFKENIDLQDRVEALEEKVTGYQRIEETLQKTLVNAQASAEEQKQNASKQAELILQDAELKARQMVNEAYSERQAIEQSMAKLKNGEQDFRFKFRQMLEGYLRQVEVSKELEQAPAAPDLARQAEAIKEAIARESAPEQPAKPASDPPAARAPAESETVPSRRLVPGSPAVVTPARGPGGVQAGVPRSDRTPDDTGSAKPEVTLSQSGKRPSEDDPIETEDPVAGEPAANAAADEAPAPRERARFGESDDLLADVDSGVNENEFKW